MDRPACDKLVNWGSINIRKSCVSQLVPTAMATHEAHRGPQRTFQSKFVLQSFLISIRTFVPASIQCFPRFIIQYYLHDGPATAVVSHRSKLAEWLSE